MNKKIIVRCAACICFAVTVRGCDHMLSENEEPLKGIAIVNKK